jgi:hypothetical protein
MAKCKRHPAIETGLSCGKCEDPICPRCMVETPVGARCPACARLSRVPTYRVSGKYYLRAIGAALGLALAIGLAWGFIRAFLPFGFLNFFIAAAAGFGIGEGISLAINRKSGTGLAVIGGITVVLSYLISTFTFWGIPLLGYGIIFDIISVAIGIFVSVTRLR